MYVASYDCSQIYIVCCSYSHCVFTIKLVQTSNAAKPTCARVNRISIVDLAGSERTAKTQAIGTRAKEAGNINPLRPILIIFTHTLFTKSHYSGFFTRMRLMPRIS